jgi:tripartite-type tricarboxylate transporter receptor subunit TctC
MNADKDQEFAATEHAMKVAQVPAIAGPVSCVRLAGHAVGCAFHPCIAAFIGGFILVCAVSAQAQPYPNKPIRMIVISAPGGSTDLLARTVGRALTESMGQTIVLDNKPGGGGIIASETLAKAQPDGYTLLLTNTSHSVLPSLHAKLPYDPLKDFAPVSLVALTHSLLLVNPSVPVKNVKELIDLARAQPGKLNYASGTTGASAHFGAELLKLMAGVNIVQVPYKGTAGQLTALISGEVQMSFVTMPSALPHVNAGRLRVLAIGSPRRSPVLPDVPTVAESGLPGFDIGAWNGILAPARTPHAIIARLNAEVAKMTQSPEAREHAAAQGVELVSDSPQEFAGYIKTQIARFAKVVKATGMRAD